MTRTDVGPPRGMLAPTSSGGSHVRVAPAIDLAPFVAHFWWVRWALETPRLAETLPHPTVHLIFEAGTARVHGVPTARFTRTLSGRGHVFGIKLRPAAIAPLWRASVSSLTDRSVPVTRVLGAGADAWAERVLAATSPERAIALAEPFLRERLPPMPAEIARLRDLVERMERDRGLLRVEDAAALARVSPRTLERQFRLHVGVTPKWVLKRYRLHEAAARLLAPRPPSLARLASELGYADQAHFTRDFKAVVGRPPSKLRPSAR